MKYVIYCRKSSDSEDRQVQSLESQEMEMRQLAEKNNLEIVGLFKESMSAKSDGRPVFNQVLDLIISGEANALICWKLDRLARNFVDGGRIIDLLQRSVIREIRTFEGTHLPSDNVLMIAMQFGMANQYSRDLSVNVKRGNRTKIERGEWPHRAPFGYFNEKASKTIRINKKSSKYVIRAFQLYSTGRYTIKQLVNLLYTEGITSSVGRKLPVSKIHKVLSNRFYCGLMEREGKVYRGNHKPLISVPIYEQVHDILNNRKHPRPKKHFYAARGFLSCASCNCALTADTKKGFKYYYCTNGKGQCIQHKKYLRSEYVDRLLSTLLLELKFDSELIEITALAYEEKTELTSVYSQTALERLLNEAKSLLEKELSLVDGLSTGLIREDLYSLKMKDIDVKRTELNCQIEVIKANNRTSTITIEQIKNAFIAVSRASEFYLKASETEKRNILENLLSNVNIENQNIVNYQFKSPFNLIAGAPKNSNLHKMLALWNDVRTALLINPRVPVIDILLREAG